MNTFTNLSNSVQITFEYKNVWVETQYLPSGEEVITELAPLEAAKKMAFLEKQGYSIKEV